VFSVQEQLHSKERSLTAYGQLNLCRYSVFRKDVFALNTEH